MTLINNGIVVTNGTLTATNIAVGDGATVVTRTDETTEIVTVIDGDDQK